MNSKLQGNDCHKMANWEDYAIKFISKWITLWYAIPLNVNHINVKATGGVRGSKNKENNKIQGKQ